MNHSRPHFAVLIFLLILILFTASTLLPARTMAFQRDHLTEQETDLVREAQVLDRRMEVFIKAIDRRLLALTDSNAAQSKQVKKDMEKWGELPTGTRAQLLSDVARILDEAITNIDDASARSPQNKLLPKAMQKLTEASTRILAQLTTIRATASDRTEREALEQGIENAQSILAAANRTGETKN